MKTYKITFNAELSEEDVRAMKKYFYDTMNESMEILNVWGLELEAIDGDNDGGKEVSFAEVLPVVMDWFSFMSDEDFESVAQDFAMAMNEGKDVMDVLIEVCGNNDLDVADFEGICTELEDLLED